MTSFVISTSRAIDNARSRSKPRRVDDDTSHTTYHILLIDVTDVTYDTINEL